MFTFLYTRKLLTLVQRKRWFFVQGNWFFLLQENIDSCPKKLKIGSIDFRLRFLGKPFLCSKGISKSEIVDFSSKIVDFQKLLIFHQNLLTFIKFKISEKNFVDFHQTWKDSPINSRERFYQFFHPNCINYFVNCMLNLFIYFLFLEFILEIILFGFLDLWIPDLRCCDWLL